MKKIKLLIILFLASFQIQAMSNEKNDAILLSNGNIISGHIVKFGKNFFKIKTSNDLLKITNNDVVMVSVGQDMTDFEKLSLGELDGKRYAKRKGGNIVLGFFTGLIGTGIVYLTSSQYPSLEAMNGPNKAIIDDPVYLRGYEKGAKSKSGGNALIGTAAWVALLIIAAAGA